MRFWSKRVAIESTAMITFMYLLLSSPLGFPLEPQGSGSVQVVKIENPQPETTWIWIWNKKTEKWVYGKAIILYPRYHVEIPLDNGEYQLSR